MLSKLSRVSASDLLAIAAVSFVIYGASLLHPAAPWGVAGVVLAVVAVELGKQEAAKRRNGDDDENSN